MSTSQTQNYIRFDIHGPGGAWRAKARALLIEINVKTDKKSKDKDTEGTVIQSTALDILRRPRIRKRAAGNKQQYDVPPRTLAARLSVENLTMILPPLKGVGKVLRLDFTDAPAINGILDYPLPENKPLDREWVPVVPTGFDFKIETTPEGRWPSWVTAARVENTTDKTFTPVNPGQLFTGYFGLEPPAAGDRIVFDVDGFALQGKHGVPWGIYDGPIIPLPGIFRFRVDPRAGDNRIFGLAVERSPQWQDSLRKYQDKAIDATALQKDKDGLPTPGSPSAGLMPAPLPAEIKWYYEKGKWVFTPGSSIFELEIRGTAGATARLIPDSIEVSQQGKKITLKTLNPQTLTAAPAETAAEISYSYSSTRSLWSGDFDVELEPGGKKLALDLSNPTLTGQPAAFQKLWFLTETGALHLPVEPNNQQLPGESGGIPARFSNETPGKSLLKGLLRLGEVPWVKQGDGSLAPDLGVKQQGILLLLNAESIEANFAFTFNGKFSCDAIDLKIQEPFLRFEDYLPVYIPPHTALTGESTPPPMPQPSEDIGNQAVNYFLNLDLVRGTKPAAAGNKPRWRLSLRFQPGKAAEKGQNGSVQEGSWLDSYMGLQVPGALVEETCYWFRPADLHWVPTFPMYGDPRDPRRDAGKRLNRERTYLPLHPLPDETIILSPGKNRQVPALKQGKFSIPIIDKQLPAQVNESIFSWLIPELPGITIGLKENGPVVIRDGRPAAGAVRWLWRSELPILDEIDALRVPPPDAQETELPLTGPGWWKQLRTLAGLAHSQRDILMGADIQFVENRVLQVSNLPVTVENLYAPQSYPGRADLSIVPPGAALFLEQENGDKIPLVRPGNLLEGPTIHFKAVIQDAFTCPALLPAKEGDPDAAIQIKAGTLVPQVIPDAGQELVFDQSGRVSFALGDTSQWGRLVRIPGENQPGQTGNRQAATYFQWTTPLLDLSSTGVDLRLYFIGLPLALQEGEAGTRYFDGQDPAVNDAILRDFRWGTIGPATIGGLVFQVFKVKEVKFSPTTAAMLEPPIQVVLQGVLHFRDGAVRLADPAAQVVRVSMLRRGGTWTLENVEGKFLWPLFGAVPDLADASREQLDDPLPWVEGEVSLNKNGTGPVRLMLGTAEKPALFLFRFLDRTWEIPLAPLDISLAAPLANNAQLEWEVLKNQSPANARVQPDGGKIMLTRGSPPRPAVVYFGVQVMQQDVQDRSILGFKLKYTIDKENSNLSLENAALLSYAGGNPLAVLESRESTSISLSSGQLSFVLNKPAGFRKEAPPFEMLPGWPISPGASLQAYVGIDLADPPAGGRVSATGIDGLQMVVETGIAAPDFLSLLLSFIIRGNEAPRMTIKLTGKLQARNQISWQSAAPNTYLVHDVEFFLRQAAIPGERLGPGQGGVFFRPRFMTSLEDPSGLAGMVEFPCLATHRVRRKKGEKETEVLSWTTPQRLRIGCPESFIEEVFLRGSKAVNLLVMDIAPQEKVPGGKAWGWYNPKKHTPGDLIVDYFPASKVETGFVGALGDELTKLLKQPGRQTMILEAGEAFWLRRENETGDSSRRSPLELWKNETQVLSGIPTVETDFYSAETGNVEQWVRLPMPFITDSIGLIEKAARTNPVLGPLLRNEAGPIAQPAELLPLPTYIRRESLLHRSLLDRYSLENRPPHPGFGSPIDQVLLQAEAYERILPYTLPIDGFEPGWLSFRDWLPGDKTGVPQNIAFPAAREILAGLLAVPAAASCFSALEMVPAVSDAEYPWQRVLGPDGKPKPYLLASPLIRLDTAALNPLDISQDIRILLEIWLPAAAASWKGGITDPILAARSVFRIGVTHGDDWETILFIPPQNQDTESTSRARVREWLSQQAAALSSVVSPLLRATLLTPYVRIPSPLPPRVYYLVGEKATAGAAIRSRRESLSTLDPLRIDPRFDPLVEVSPAEPLLLGTDYRAGQVYYEPGTWFEPTHVPAAGSGVGLAYEICGTPPGPGHNSRLSWAGEGAIVHRWLETSRDLMFTDITRRDIMSQFEPGWLLPGSRKIPRRPGDIHVGLSPFLGARAVQVFTNGRPGSMMRVRSAILNEDAEGMVRRTASIAHELRHPRPVPLPGELYPFAPGVEFEPGSTGPHPTAKVTNLDGPVPFRYRQLDWQDPLFNRRLLAVGKETGAEAISLSIDRSIYGAVDVIYPEIKIFPGTGKQKTAMWLLWESNALEIEIKVSIRRLDKLTPFTLAEFSSRVTPGGVIQNPAANTLHWVWELGLDQPEAGDFVIDKKLENLDRIEVEAVVYKLKNNSKEEYLRFRLGAVIRTDVEVWPQPQNAYGIIRKEVSAGFEKSEMAAFGWLPKPLVVKRGNRFRPDKWEGTFRYTDVFAAVPGSSETYEVISFTSYGEQKEESKF